MMLLHGLYTEFFPLFSSFLDITVDFQLSNNNIWLFPCLLWIWHAGSGLISTSGYLCLLLRRLRPPFFSSSWERLKKNGCGQKSPTRLWSLSCAEHHTACRLLRDSTQSVLHNAARQYAHCRMIASLYLPILSHSIIWYVPHLNCNTYDAWLHCSFQSGNHAHATLLVKHYHISMAKFRT